MVQSLNTKVDLTIKANSYLGLPKYGKVMIGDKAFEFYNDKNVTDYIQIPWEEVNCVIASVWFGRYIPRFGFKTKDGIFTFSTQKNKQTLRAVQKYIKPENMVRSLSFFDILKRGIKNLFTRKK